MEKSMNKIVALAKHRGFIFPGSDIYGGLANAWDYGPLGVELKNNVKKAWWKKFIQQIPENVGLDSAIFMNPKAWEASGHIGNFNDPMIDCKNCKARHRADKLIENALELKGIELVVDGLPFEKMEKLIQEHNISCPDCDAHDFTEIRQFNLMFKTHIGATENSSSEVYLRPETAQGIFVNFEQVQRSMSLKVPFGIGQIGKSFRNEITPGNFIFRTREFEQMELEFFCKPGDDLHWFNHWKEKSYSFLLSLGMNEENLRIRDHKEDELSHYSNATSDIEYKFPFGWGELWGIADRTDFDLKAHMSHSGANFTYTDPHTGEKYVPYCIEPSVGVDRLTLAFLADAYDEEELPDGKSRTVLRLHPALAPVKVAVMSLSKKLAPHAQEIHLDLVEDFNCQFDGSGNVGKSYRRQDEIGTPFCVMFDYDSLEDKCVTVRDRDTMEQVRMPISELKSYLSQKMKF